MNDMSSVIIPRSDQINADSLLAGPIVITITNVTIKPGTEQPVTINYDGDDGKPWRPCKSTSRCLVAAWGADAREYVGRSVRLFCDPNVTWGGMKVGGIRISHMSHIERELVIALTATKGKKVVATIKPLVVDQAPPKPDKAADGVRTLIARINSVDDGNLANITDDPVVVKQRAWLSTNRPELAAEVDAAIAAKLGDDDPFGLPPIDAEGPADQQRGEQHNATSADEQTATSLIAQIADEKTSDALDSLMARSREQVDALPDDLQETVRAAYFARFEKLSK